MGFFEKYSRHMEEALQYLYITIISEAILKFFSQNFLLDVIIYTTIILHAHQ